VERQILVVVGRKPVEEERVRKKAAKSNPRARQTRTPRCVVTGAGSMNRL